MSENYENMSNEEIKEQLEWSDHHEFSYNYAIWAFEEIDRLNNIINELEEDINNQLMMTRKMDKYNEGFFNATLHFYNKLKALKEDK